MASSLGMNPSITLEPALVGMPLTWMTSLTEIGRPWTGLRNLPSARSWSSNSAIAIDSASGAM